MLNLDKKNKVQNTNKKSDAIILLIIFGAVMLFMWWISSQSKQNVGEKVSSSIFSHREINPSLLTVEYRVTNTTENAGISECSITMKDKSNTYVGSDFGYKSAKEIMPGETYSGIANLKISNNGAQYITEGSIDCTLE